MDFLPRLLDDILFLKFYDLARGQAVCTMHRGGYCKMESVILIQWLETTGLGRWFVGLVQVTEMEIRVSNGSLVGQMLVA